MQSRPIERISIQELLENQSEHKKLIAEGIKAAGDDKAKGRIFNKFPILLQEHEEKRINEIIATLTEELLKNPINPMSLDKIKSGNHATHRAAAIAHKLVNELMTIGCSALLAPNGEVNPKILELFKIQLPKEEKEKQRVITEKSEELLSSFLENCVGNTFIKAVKAVNIMKEKQQHQKIDPENQFGSSLGLLMARAQNNWHSNTIEAQKYIKTHIEQYRQQQQLQKQLLTSLHQEIIHLDASFSLIKESEVDTTTEKRNFLAQCIIDLEDQPGRQLDYMNLIKNMQIYCFLQAEHKFTPQPAATRSLFASPFDEQIIVKHETPERLTQITQLIGALKVYLNPDEAAELAIQIKQYKESKSHQLLVQVKQAKINKNNLSPSTDRPSPTSDTPSTDSGDPPTPTSRPFSPTRR
jgi:hypothetical protein